MKNYSTVNGVKVTYVVIEQKRSEHEQPNFLGTGKALVGMLKNGQSLQDFLLERKNIRKRVSKRIDRAIREFESLKRKNLV